MLEYHFPNMIKKDGIHRLPVIAGGPRPRVGALPIFLHRPATDVDETDEEKCFKKICKVISDMYADCLRRGLAEGHSFPAARKKFMVPKTFDELMVKLAPTEKLCKFFERCGVNRVQRNGS